MIQSAIITINQSSKQIQYNSNSNRIIKRILNSAFALYYTTSTGSSGTLSSPLHTTYTIKRRYQSLRRYVQWCPLVSSIVCSSVCPSVRLRYKTEADRSNWERRKLGNDDDDDDKTENSFQMPSEMMRSAGNRFDRGREHFVHGNKRYKEKKPKSKVIEDATSGAWKRTLKQIFESSCTEN